MHTNRISPARKIIVWLVAVMGLALLAGCETVTLTNLTADSMPENPSQIYTFSVRVTPRSNMVSGVMPHIVVDGKSFDMKRSALGEGIYDFEYQLPAGRDEVAYYFLVNYSIEGNGRLNPAEAYTEISRVKILRRYVLKLEDNRGPVGARVSVLGRGFTPQDTLTFNGTAVRTVFESPNAISFFVPALDPNRNYQVALNGASGNSPVGTFRIDPSRVDVSPSALTLRTGERTSLTFTVPNPAPAGGMLLDVTTDVPESIIMPEVIVPQGQTQVSVRVEGGKPGQGYLFLKGFATGEISIPLSVSAR
jgi:hypothetical protein